MSLSELFVLHAIRLSGPIDFTELQNGRMMASSSILRARSAGEVDPLFTAIQSQTPGWEAESGEIKRVLDAIGISGLAISSTATMFLKQVTQKGDRTAAGTSVHTSLAIASGMICWNRIQARGVEPATVSLQIAAIYNGSVDPVVATNDTTLSGTPAADEHWTVGPISLNGTVYAGIQSVSIDLGISLFLKASDGEQWPTFVAIQTRNPVVEFTTDDPKAWGLYGLNGVALSSGSVYLRKFAANADRVAVATQEHIGFSLPASGLIHAEATEAGDNNEATTTVRVELNRVDGSTPPLTYDTTAAIA